MYNKDKDGGGSNDGTNLLYKSAKSGCTGYSFTTDGSGTCFLFDTKEVAAGGGGSLANGECFTRKTVTNAVAVTTGTNALWKKFWDYRGKEYLNAAAAYNTNIDHASGWAEYEKKGAVERKRLADVAQWTLETAKAKAVMDGYKSATLDGVESTKTSASSTRNTAYGKITDLAYY